VTTQMPGSADMHGFSLQLEPEDGLPKQCLMSHVLAKADNTFKVNCGNMHAASSSGWNSVPVFGIPPKLSSTLAEEFLAGTRSPTYLEQLLAQYNKCNPITAWKCNVFLNVRTVWNLLRTDHFFRHLEQRRAHIKAVRTTHTRLRLDSGSVLSRSELSEPKMAATSWQPGFRGRCCIATAVRMRCRRRQR
jgi:hypothetical protein